MALRPRKGPIRPRGPIARPTLGPPPAATGVAAVRRALSIQGPPTGVSPRSWATLPAICGVLAAIPRNLRCFRRPPGRLAVRGPSPQPPDSRVRASFSRRPPAETPAWASSPKSSATDAASSVPLGGATERPCSIDSSAAKPWRGIGGSDDCGRLPSTGLGRACAARLGVFCGRVCAARLGAPRGRARAAASSAVGSDRAWDVGCGPVCPTTAGLARPAGAVSRAAARRALGRWGRVLGRLESTPGSRPGWTLSSPPVRGCVRAPRRSLRGSPVRGGLIRAQSSRT
jgi:hypothetical protein